MTPNHFCSMWINWMFFSENILNFSKVLENRKLTWKSIKVILIICRPTTKFQRQLIYVPNFPHFSFLSRKKQLVLKKFHSLFHFPNFLSFSDFLSRRSNFSVTWNWTFSRKANEKSAREIFISFTSFVRVCKPFESCCG